MATESVDWADRVGNERRVNQRLGRISRCRASPHAHHDLLFVIVRCSPLDGAHGHHRDHPRIIVAVYTRRCMCAARALGSSSVAAAITILGSSSHTRPAGVQLLGDRGRRRVRCAANKDDLAP